MGVDVKHYTVELRIREAGDVGDALAVKAFLELPYRGETFTRVQWKQHATVGGAVQWLVNKAWEWMRNRETGQ